MVAARGRWLAFGALSVVLGLALALLLAEALFRLRPLPPRTQVVRHLLPPDRRPPGWDPAVPVWQVEADRRNDECLRDHPGAPRVLFLGDSIFYGTSLPGDAVFTRRMQQALAGPGGPGACLLNHAQPGFSGQQKAEMARRLLPALEPAVLYWQVWQPDSESYTGIGDAAYNLTNHVVDAGGIPSAWGLPPALNRWLFLHSRLYEYATLALALAPPRPPEDDAWSREAGRRLRETRDLALARGARLVLVVATALDRPFGDATPGPSSLESKTAALAQQLDIPWISLQELLKDQDVLRVRLDECCHLNAEGHAALADRLLPDLRERLRTAGR